MHSGKRYDYFPSNTSGEIKEIVSVFVCENNEWRAMRGMLLIEDFQVYSNLFWRIRFVHYIFCLFFQPKSHTANVLVSSSHILYAGGLSVLFISVLLSRRKKKMLFKCFINYLDIVFVFYRFLLVKIQMVCFNECSLYVLIFTFKYFSRQ